MSALVGIQIGAISFVDEGVEPVLDGLKETAGVNALFIASQAFDRGVAGRQVLTRPWPGHGPQDFTDLHLGGSFVTQHERYYGGTVLGPYRAPDAEVAGFDALGDVIEPARRRGLKVYSWVLENTHSGLTKAVPNWPKVLQVDAWERTDGYACLRNPDYEAWWLSLLEDQVKTYQLDGLLFGSERQGPLDNAFSDGGFARNGNPYCFCRHCLAEAARQGLDSERARQGYLELDRLMEDQEPGEPAGDSSFVRFLSLLGRYPEIVAWDQFWQDGYTRFQARMYGALKFLDRQLEVGWHIWHHNSFSPLYRSQVDFARMAHHSDFIKPVLYNNCAGYRLHHYIRTVGRRLFRGVPEQVLYDLHRHLLGYDEAVPFERLPELGLSPDYVERETRRTVAAVRGQAAVYPGLDVDVPTPEGVKKTTPDEVRASVRAALAGGGDGFVLSRKYSEMSWQNLAAVGQELTSQGLRA
ncbi:MAG: hypothetical protein LBJ44_07565 [Propionibacteriaceae bacterium]|jgi:hypothetical protein|nr:hypothetical protein [Propionibacteriaceae bacterium]